MRRAAAAGSKRPPSPAQRRKSLELEAQRQHTALKARFESWDTAHTFALVAGAGSLALGLMAIPKLKRILSAGLRSTFRE